MAFHPDGGGGGHVGVHANQGSLWREDSSEMSDASARTIQSILVRA